MVHHITLFKEIMIDYNGIMKSLRFSIQLFSPVMSYDEGSVDDQKVRRYIICVWSVEKVFLHPKKWRVE